MNVKKIFGIIAISFSAAFATPSQMTPGLWEITTTMEMPGMPGGGYATKNRICMRADDMEMEKKGLDEEMSKTCKITNMKSSRSNLSYDISCSGEQPMKGKVKMSFKADSYTGTMVMDMGGENAMKMTTRYSGKRIGKCK